MSDPVLFGPDGQPFQVQEKDLQLLGILWRGSNILILTNRDAIKRLNFDDKRRTADMLRKIFEQDFGVLL